MVDPSNITNYNLSDIELEEHILFWVCAAGKNGHTAARCLNNLLSDLKMYFSPMFSPFELLKSAIIHLDFPDLLKRNGIGCYNIKAKTLIELVNFGINLRTCTADALDTIYGIGPKTARCFILHSRKGARYAGLDRHLLTYLRDVLKVDNVPKSTPSSMKEYKRLEDIFIKHVDELGKTPAELDLEIWNTYSK